MLYTSRVLWAKVESTYGTDATPTASESIITTGLSIQPYAGNTVSIDIDEPTLGGSQQINTGPNVTVSFGVYMAGSGAAGTAPYWGQLMRACGFSETISASTSVTYEPVSTGFESLTLYFNVDGQKHVIKGARGDFTLSMGRGQIPVINFTFTGLYATPSAASMALDKTAFISPLPVTKTNTPTFTLQGYAALAESFSYSQNNNIVYRNVIGGENVLLTNRGPSGQFLIEAPAIGTKDFFSAVESHDGITTGAFQIVHGTTAGNIITIDAPAVQLTSISEQNSDDIEMYQMDAQFLNASGDDDFVITLT
jgi:hypothetical protein